MMRRGSKRLKEARRVSEAHGAKPVGGLTMLQARMQIYESPVFFLKQTTPPLDLHDSLVELMTLGESIMLEQLGISLQASTCCIVRFKSKHARYEVVEQFV